MRITTLLIGIQACFATLLIAGTTSAQNVSLDVRNTNVSQVFSTIEKQAGVTFVYNKTILKDLNAITIKVSNKPLGEVLQLISSQLPLTFKQSGSVIGVSKITAPSKSNAKEAKADPKLLLMKISGKILDEKGQPLAGATIQVKGTDLKTSSDINGLFEINNAPDNVMLVMSFIGYSTQEIAISGLSQPVTIRMEPDNSKLSEVSVVSTGYQQLPKERATGSFAKIDNETYNREVSTDIISRLNGIAPGVLFDSRFGSKQKFSIRGRSTILANDNPLIVIDNFPYDGDINNINPNDVESITILKDAAAASIWGVRAGNGVIVITTKKGRNDQPLKVEWNSNVTVGNKPDLFYSKNFLDASNYVDVEQLLFNKGYYDGDLNNTTTRPVISPVVEILAKKRSGALSATDADGQINALRSNDVRNDFNKFFYRKSVSQQYSLSISGGSAKTTYLFSAGYDNNRQSAVGNSYSRLNLSAYNSFKPVKNLDLSYGLYYVQSESASAPSDYNSIKLSGTKSVYPYAQLADDAGSPLALPNYYRLSYLDGLATGGKLLDWKYRPLQEVNAADNKTTISEIRFTPGIKYTLADGLNAEIRYQYERSTSLNRNDQGQQTYFTRDLINKYTSVSGTTVTRPVPVGDILDLAASTMTGNTARAQVNYNKAFSKHAISALAGTEAKQLTNDSYSNRLYGYNNDLGTNNSALDYTTFFPFYITGSGSIPNTDSNTGATDRYLSYFANASYTYDSRYILSASARIDKSNLFGVKTNQKSVPLWSAGIAWNLGSEAFYHIGWLPYLKLRATYGYGGNVDKTVTALTTGSYTTDLYTGAQSVKITNPGNPELRWEKTGQYNLGADFETRNSILSGSVEYYIKKGVDLIGNSSVDPTTGIINGANQSVVKGNFADFKSHGMDIQLNSRNIDGHFKWGTSLLASYNKDEVTRYNVKTTAANYLNFGSGTDPNQLYPYEGHPVYSIYSYKWAGLDPATGDPMGYDANGNVSKDYVSLTAVAPDGLVYNGPALPVVFGSLRNTFSYGPVSLSVNIAGKFGYYFRRTSINYTELFVNWTGNADYAKRWQQPGDELTTNVPSFPTLPLNSNRDMFYKFSGPLVEKGDHIRLQDVQLGYDLDRKQWRKLPVNSVRFYAYANNIGILWRANRSGTDPDLYGSTLPQPFTLSFGFKGNF